MSVANSIMGCIIFVLFKKTLKDVMSKGVFRLYILIRCYLATPATVKNNNEIPLLRVNTASKFKQFANLHQKVSHSSKPLIRRTQYLIANARPITSTTIAIIIKYVFSIIYFSFLI